MKEEAVGLLTKSLVGGEITVRQLRTLAEGQREQLEGEEKRVEGK